VSLSSFPLKKRLDMSLLNVEVGRDFRRRLKLPSPPVGEEGKGEREAKARPGGLIALWAPTFASEMLTLGFSLTVIRLLSYTFPEKNLLPCSQQVNKILIHFSLHKGDQAWSLRQFQLMFPPVAKIPKMAQSLLGKMS
jgi:hypothetical protein